MHFKILIVGDSDVGKTSWLKRHETGEFITKYTPTTEDNKTILEFNTNHYGLITLEVWDFPGKEGLKDARRGQHNDADGAIVMFDTTSRQTFQNVYKHWIPILNKLRFDGFTIPIVICGNKCEIKDRKVSWAEIKTNINTDHYYEISSKSNYNFEKPFLDLLRRLVCYQKLELVDMPALTPPEVSLTLPKELTNKTTKVKVSLSIPTPTYKYVNMINLPDDGVMKVTHEYYPDAEILKY